MPFFEDSYQTTIGSVMVTKTIVEALRKAMIRDYLDRVSLNVRKEGDVTPVFVIGSSSSEAEIPPFAHPIMVTDSHHQKTLCTDLRFYVTRDAQASEIEKSIRNGTEFNFAKSRAILNLLWVTNRVGEIRIGLSFAGVVFAALIAQAVTRTYSLDYRDQTAVAIASHFYYQTLFSEETEFSEEAREAMATHTIKATKAPAELVFQVYDKIKEISNVEDFCNTLQTITENVRLKDFNTLGLLTMMRNVWMATNSKEIISVAVEHPPTWIAMVYSALTERTFKNSTLAKVAETYGKRGAADEFLKNYRSIMAENTETHQLRSHVMEELHQLGTFE